MKSSSEAQHSATGPSKGSTVASVQEASQLVEEHFDNCINEQKLNSLISMVRLDVRSEQADQAVAELERQSFNAQCALYDAGDDASPDQLQAIVERHTT